MASIDARPYEMNLMLWAGNVTTQHYVWPHALTGRTFAAALNGEPLAVTVDDDTVSVSFTDEDTEALGATGNRWTLTETTDGAAQVLVTGVVSRSERGTSTPSDSTVVVMEGEVTVQVSVIGGATNIIDGGTP